MTITKKERLTIKAKEILEATPAGTRFSELVGQLQNATSNCNVSRQEDAHVRRSLWS
jgi:hypothetical protein